MAGVLLILAGVGYSAWLLEFMLPTGLSAWVSDVSDHFVVGQPYRQLFRTTDMIAGALLMLAAAAWWRTDPRRPAARAGLIAVALLGAATVVDALFTPDCVATVAAGCRRRELAVQVSAHHLVHLGSSAVAAVSTLAAAAALARIAPVGWWRWWARALLATVVAGQVLSIALYPGGGGGGAQRVQLLAAGAGLVAVGVVASRGRG